MRKIHSRMIVAGAILAAALLVTWLAGLTHRDLPSPPGETAFYQCPMHPNVRSASAGRCTLCGMELTRLTPTVPAMKTPMAGVTLSADAITVAGVSTTIVASAPLIRTLRVAGVMEDNAKTRYRVAAGSAGRVEVLHARQPGALIRPGEPLIEIYSPAILTIIRRQTALRRLVRTPAPEGTPSITIEQQRMLDGGDQQLILMGLTQAQCDALIDGPENPTRTTILAPIGGAVLSVFAQAGASFREGDALFEIADLSTIAFVFDAYEDDLPWLATGLTLTVRVPATPGVTFEAQLGNIPAEVDPTTRLAHFRAPLSSAPTRLINHTFAEADIRLETPAVLAVPLSAVLATGAAPLVYVETATGTYEPRQVRLGRAGDAAWEILEGLAEGERVVVAGAMLLDAQAQLTAAPSVAVPACEHCKTP